jgi:hypothetical protein
MMKARAENNRNLMNDWLKGVNGFSVLRNASQITVRFAACHRGTALHTSKTTVAMAMLDFEVFDQHHDFCVSPQSSRVANQDSYLGGVPKLVNDRT